MNLCYNNIEIKRNKNIKEKVMMEKYLNLENGTIVEVEIFKGKKRKNSL